MTKVCPDSCHWSLPQTADKTDSTLNCIHEKIIRRDAFSLLLVCTFVFSLFVCFGNAKTLLCTEVILYEAVHGGLSVARCYKVSRKASMTQMFSTYSRVNTDNIVGLFKHFDHLQICFKK